MNEVDSDAEDGGGSGGGESAPGGDVVVAPAWLPVSFSFSSTFPFISISFS